MWDSSRAYLLFSLYFWLRFKDAPEYWSRGFISHHAAMLAFIWGQTWNTWKETEVWTLLSWSIKASCLRPPSAAQALYGPIKVGGKARLLSEQPWKGHRSAWASCDWDECDDLLTQRRASEIDWNIQIQASRSVVVQPGRPGDLSGP